MSDSPIRWMSPSVAYFENRLKELEHDASEKTIFLQLTPKELTLMQFGLMWIVAIYGMEAVSELHDKLVEIIEAQEFCDCPRCRARRASREESNDSQADAGD